MKLFIVTILLLVSGVTLADEWYLASFKTGCTNLSVLNAKLPIEVISDIGKGSTFRISLPLIG